MKFKTNDLIAYITYAHVTNIERDSISVADIDGTSFKVEGQSLLEKAESADFFETEENMSKTKVVEKLCTSNGKPFTVEFEKQNGDLRILRGVYVSHDAGFGRSNVLDLDCTDTHKLRQVDHRTIHSLILSNVKYTVK